ncbi:MAG: fimbrial biogenesis outer membrane usher protein [Candidatus Saccharibacteria bacterium]|nr:fimbrial biogenesis outer membrane usher protein [Pseudorhodobacter sp.]
MTDSAPAQQSGSLSQRELFLEVFINDAATGLITRFSETAGGGLTADGQELANTGILPLSKGAQGEIRVDQLPGVTYQIDEAAQTISFVAVEAALATKMITAAPEADTAALGPPPDAVTGEPEANHVDTGSGVVLNYNLSLETQIAGSGAMAFGDFDFRLFLPIGALSHSFSLSEAEAGSDSAFSYTRLETFWRTALPNQAVQVQIGDITTRGPTWTTPVRLGGILIERNFDLRPDLVTIPLPGFEGSAAVPSTVDVYADSIRRFSTSVPAGPFSLTDLPFGTGSGNAEVILRDVTGHETRIDLPFMVSSDLMRKGLVDYAVALGRPRLGIGTETDRYGTDLVGAATLRFGLTNAITLATHVESGADLQMGGVGATFRVGTFGTASLNVAHSGSDLGTGTLVDAQAGLTFGTVHASGRMMRTEGDFADIARATAESVGPDVTLPGLLISLNQLSISMPFGQGGAFGTASLFYADAHRFGAGPDSSLGVSYSRQIMHGSTLNVTLLAVKGDTSDVVMGLGLYIPLGDRVAAGAGIEHRDGNWRQTLSAAGHPADQTPGWNWQMQATHDIDTSLQASTSRQFAYGTLNLGTRLSGTEQSAGLRLEGALVASGGGLFATNRIDDAFAVVDAGAPGVDVLFENRSVGTTGRSGKLLVPGLRSYDTNSLAIDPATLPLDADVPATSSTIRPAHRSGVKVDFAISANPASAMVALVTPQGEPMPVGLTAVLTGTGEPFLIGYDGMVYALGLAAQNEMMVQTADGSTCRAEFAYVDEPGTISQIDGVVCQ